MVKANPTWARDELILALELYFRHNPLSISKNHPEVAKLSELLNRLPIHQVKSEIGDFRNPNGVYMKMCNFLRLDPGYTGKGLTRGGAGEEEVWNYFANNRTALENAAEHIRNLAHSTELDDVRIPVAEEEEVEAPEGKLLFRLHRIRERNPSLARKKKAKVLANTGRLQCEVCDFDFEERYGQHGKEYIECHHVKPLSELEPGAKTRLADLALVCSNCHSMLHRNGNFSIDQLRAVIMSTPKSN